MQSSSSISRRIAHCLAAYQSQDYETALIHYFPALDKVAKKRHHNAGVGERIRKFLKRDEALISAISTGNIFKDCTIDGLTFPQAIYKFGRTSVLHEGELDKRLKFTTNSSWSIGEVWELPHTYILGLCIAVICAPECKDERIGTTDSLTIYGRTWTLDDLWGRRDLVVAHLENLFPFEGAFD